MTRARAFTLIELLVALSLIAILGALAAPSLTSLVRTNESVVVRDELVRALAMARSQAVISGSPTAVCARDGDRHACSGAETWDSGWVAFVDRNDDGHCVDSEPDGLCDADSGEVITVAAGHEVPGLRISGNYFIRTEARFTPQGHAHLSNGTFSICADADDVADRGIIISNPGRTRLTLDPADLDC